MMSDGSWNEIDKQQRLSMLIDGEGDAQAASDTCSAWRHDAELRAAWHTYHLIGDVLRSEDLAHPVARDAAFLAELRARLAKEPVVLAPQPAMPAEPAQRRRRRMGSVAIAASIGAVATVLVISQLAAPDTEEAGRTVVALPPAQSFVPPAQGVVRPVAAHASSDTDVNAVAADGKLIRDARLDRYLAAHKQYGDGSALVPPGGILRSSVVVPAR
jgi:sigma-E factor negative regulatory protein RseA